MGEKLSRKATRDKEKTSSQYHMSSSTLFFRSSPASFQIFSRARVSLPVEAVHEFICKLIEQYIWHSVGTTCYAVFFFYCL